MASEELRDSLFRKEDQRENFKQVIAKRSDLAQFAGGRMANAAPGATVLHRAGTVLGLASSGPDMGRYKPYSNAAADGSEVAVGVLSEDAVVDQFGNGSEISVIQRGDLLEGALIGLDAAARTDLNAKSYTEHGTIIVHIG